MFQRYLAIVLFLSLLAASAASAQGLPGYVVTLRGDTLRGILAENSKQQRVRLFTSDDNQTQSFSAAQIRGYGLRGQALIGSAVVRQANGDAAHYFVLPRLVGPVSLYTFTDEKGLLLRPDALADTLYELSATNWHLLFNRYLVGCPTLDLTEARVLDLRFEERHVVQLLARYNHCLSPDWKTSSSVKSVIYRKSWGLEADFGHIRFGKLSSDYPGGGTSQRLLFVLSSVRASGFQSELGLGYTRSTARTDFHPVEIYNPTQPNQILLAEQKRTQLNLLTGMLRTSQRLGKPNRPSLLVGLELGFNYNLRTTDETYQRPLAGGPTTQTNQDIQSGGGGALHLSASAGVVLPLASQKEIRLSAIYQQFVLTNLRVLGLRAAYCLYRN